MSLVEFQELKSKRKISMVTCYDATFAQLIDDTPIDAVLVGDSSAMVMQGHQDTLHADTDSLCLFVRSVANGLRKKPIVADMPFMSFRKGLESGAHTAERLVRAGAHAVKLEGLTGNEALISHIVSSGIPVMGHLGLTPQFIHQMGGYKVQGREKDSAELMVAQAKQLEHLGVFSVVLECVPSSLARKITEEIAIPTIGIGAGPDTDGQILVLQDLLGLGLNKKPKFVREYMQLRDSVREALSDYHNHVLSSAYPSPEESYQ